MRDAGNIRSIAALQPDYMGFIFYERSKRFTGKDFTIPEISPAIKKVGVFVNEKKEKILETVRKYNLYAVQLHGEESPEFCQELGSSVRIIKAFGISKKFDFSILGKYEKSCSCFLFDTKTEDYGGSGNAFDWSLLNNYKGRIPFFLSGGIDLNHMKQIPNLKSQTRLPDGQVSNLYAIDVNSKFEISPGIKDIEKIKKLKDELLGK